MNQTQILPKHDIDNQNYDQFREEQQIQPPTLKEHMFLFVFSTITIAGIAANGFLVLYIRTRRLWQSYVSTYFVAHAAATNLLICAYFLPIYLYNLATKQNAYQSMFANATFSRTFEAFNVPVANIACRIHAFLFVTATTVQYYMAACIAGVHLLTYARIHYEHLFGFKPSIICGLTWLIGAALALPCLTNNALVQYNPELYHCLWHNSSKIGLHFFIYVVLLGYLLPLGLANYAYIRILIIFYDCPVVFRALGVYRARYLLLLLIIAPLITVPFYVLTLWDDEGGYQENNVDTSDKPNDESLIGSKATLYENPGDTFSSQLWSESFKTLYAASGFLTYGLCFLNGVFYSVSLFLMKEYDMQCERNAQKKSISVASSAARNVVVGIKRNSINLALNTVEAQEV